MARQAGARKAMPLAVSVPCHSDLMRAASEELAHQLASTRILQPSIPVVNNIDAGIELDPEKIREKLIVQLYSPVLWVDCVNTMAAQGVNKMLECGPGKVLCGMNKRIVRDLDVLSTQDNAAFAAALAAVSSN
jgi:[acyl-carrier-protein] S-malonyltransferase